MGHCMMINRETKVQPDKLESLENKAEWVHQGNLEPREVLELLDQQ